MFEQGLGHLVEYKNERVLISALFVVLHLISFVPLTPSRGDIAPINGIAKNLLRSG